MSVHYYTEGFWSCICQSEHAISTSQNWRKREINYVKCRHDNCDSSAKIVDDKLILTVCNMLLSDNDKDDAIAVYA